MQTKKSDAVYRTNNLLSNYTVSLLEGDTDQAAISNVLADLMHYCEYKDISFNSLIQEAQQFVTEDNSFDATTGDKTMSNQNEIHTLRQHIANLRETVYATGLAIDGIESYSLTPAKPLYDVIHALEGEIAEYNTQLEYLLNL